MPNFCASAWFSEVTTFQPARPRERWSSVPKILATSYGWK